MRQECHGKSEQVLICFVDIRKAFDSFPRDILLSKILDMGVTGKFFNIIRHIYTSDKACVKTGQSHSEFFTLDTGVRQGCVLSPLLFKLFLSDLAKKLDTVGDKIELGNLGINCIFGQMN